MRDIKPDKRSIALLLTVLIIFYLGLNPILASGRKENKNNLEKIKENNDTQTVSESVYGKDSIMELKAQFLEGYETDRFIIKYKDNKLNIRASNDLRQRLRRSFKASKELKGKKTKKNRFEVVVTNKKMKKNQLLAQLKAEKMDSEIEYIQPDYKLSIAANDPYYHYQWGIYNSHILTTTSYKETVGGAVYEEVYREIPFRIDANVPGAWSEASGEGVIIALIDTGIDITHEDLYQSIWQNTGEIPDNGIDDDMNGYIDDINGWNFLDNSKEVYINDTYNEEWHGTHTAGIIAGTKDNQKGITGAAPKSKIMPLKVFGSGTAYTSDIIEAISYAETMGAKIVNCSFGGAEENPALREAIEASEMIFVAAAGNNSINIDENPIYPASYNSPNIITVSSINKNGLLSSFSNYGKNTVDTAAPGENILSTIPNNRYGYSSGTSMSAAFASGEAALILERYGDITPEEIKKKITSTSDRLSSLLDKVHRGNKINVENAVLNTNLNTDEIITIEESTSVSESVYQSVYGVGTYTLFSIDLQSIDLNTEALEEQTETLNLLLDHVKILKKLIKALEEARNRAGLIANNIEAIITHNNTIQLITSEIDALREMIKYSSKRGKINANTQAIKQHTITLNMLLRELKAANDLVIIKSERTMVNITKDKSFNIILTASSLNKDSGDISYSINYNKNEIEPLDLCGLTVEEELTTGEIPDTGITITEFNPLSGEIKFKIKNSTAPGKAWTGILNSIKFKAKHTGSTEIKIKIN